MAQIVTLQQVRTFLRYTNPSEPCADDSMLQVFIDGAYEVLRFECDDTLPREYSERYDGGSFKVFTYHRPVLRVNNLEEGWGWINYELDYQDANTPPADTTMFGYSIDNPEVGEISRRSVASVAIPFIPGEKNIWIQYTAGLDPVPPNITLGTLMLIQHFWNNSMMRSVALAGANIAYDAVSGTTYTRDTESGNQNLNIGVPFSVLEQIKGNRHLPIIA